MHVLYPTFDFVSYDWTGVIIVLPADGSCKMKQDRLKIGLHCQIIGFCAIGA